jgi:Glycosyl hydrolase catalytic core
VRALTVVGLLAVLLGVASPASASTHIRYGIQDDAWLEYGPGTLDQRLATIQSLNVPLVRFTIHWDQVAPTKPTDAASPDDPAYDWRLADSILDGLRAYRLTPIVTLLGSPPWANGGKPSNYAPTHAADFGRFARAAARRYPWVKYWLVWNEPNQERWLRPASARVYVQRLLNPAYAVIHTEVRGAKVGGGVTAPRAGTGGVAPVTWILAMAKAGAHLDAYAHHPYPSSPAETPFSGGCRRCLTITMATIERLVSTVTRAFGPKRIWLTEYGYQTRPPDPFGVSLSRQAAYIGQAALRAYETPRVDMLIQYLYRDEPTLARFQSGLRFKNNAVKPSLLAFQLPFAEKSRSGSRVVVWGQLRAGAGAHAYRVDVWREGVWHALRAGSTGAAGFFTLSVHATAGDLLRVWSPSQRLASLSLRVV